MTPSKFIQSLNLPNIITVARILLTPLFLIFLEQKRYGSALLIFFAAAVSDGLDGFLARYFNQRTELGAYLDPLADKLLLNTAFVGMAVMGLLPVWLTVVVISRDVLILLGVAIFFITGTALKVDPSIVSKATTFMQLTTVCLTLLSLSLLSVPIWILQLCYAATIIFTIASGGHYLILGLRLLQEHNDQP
jgi:cardiolipin synthase